MGDLTIITGPMFSGKTTLLFAHAKKACQPVVYIKHARDTRSGPRTIASHDGVCVPALEVTSLREVTMSEDVQDVFIDEGHFFPDLDVADQWAQEGKRVTLATLISDHCRRLFPNVQDILAKADQEANGLRGEGEAEAIGILAKALNEDPEFFAFQRSLESYRNFMNDQTTIILSSDADVFKFLQGPGVAPAGGN